MTTETLSPTPRSTIRRMRERARTDRGELYAVLDAGQICHLGVVVDGSPVVLPTGYGWIGDTLYLHGSTGARSLAAAAGSEVSVTVTLVDGVVYARAAMHFSMNYRSAVVHGRPRLVTDPDERLTGLAAIVEHLAPGSWDYARRPNKKELAATTVLALDLHEAAVKVRAAGPSDDADDVATGGIWAGVLPVRPVFDPAVPGADVDDVPLPAHVAERVTSGAR